MSLGSCKSHGRAAGAADARLLLFAEVALESLALTLQLVVQLLHVQTLLGAPLALFAIALLDCAAQATRVRGISRGSEGDLRGARHARFAQPPPPPAR